MDSESQQARVTPGQPTEPTETEGRPLATVIALRDPARADRRHARRRRRWRTGTADAGMATAEYAVVLLAAVGFAGLLIVILTSGEVREMLTGLVRDALSV
jgi:hypothetical protein